MVFSNIQQFNSSDTYNNYLKYGCIRLLHKIKNNIDNCIDIKNENITITNEKILTQIINDILQFSSDYLDDNNNIDLV